MVLKTRQVSKPNSEPNSKLEQQDAEAIASRPKNSPKTESSSAATPSLRERLAQKRKAARLRKEITNFSLFSVFFAVMVGAPLAIVGGVKIAAAAVVGVLALAFSIRYPWLALWGFLIYLPFGGTITYMIGNSPLLQLAKDGLYLPGLFGIVQYCKRERLPLLIPKGLIPAIVILLFFCGLTLFGVNGYQEILGDPDEKPFAMGILGLKVLLGYAPLVICAYYLLRTRADLLRLTRLMTVLAIACCSLGLVQYLLLLTGRCEGTRFAVGADLFRATLDARCFVGGALVYSPQQNMIRLPGTFVAPWQWGWFLISNSFLIFPTAFNEPKFYWRIAGYVALGLIFVMAVVSGQRIALALVPLAIGILLVFTGQIVNLKRFIPVAIVLGVTLTGVALNNMATVEERINSFISRWNASPPYAFIVEQMRWSLQENWLLGHGLGRATNSARALGETELVETYYPKLIYEIGPWGTIAFLGVVTVLSFLCFKAYRSLRDPSLRGYGAAFWLFVLFISYNTYYYPLDVDPVAVYYWFFAGVVLKLPQIEKQWQREALEELAASQTDAKGKKGRSLQKKSHAPKPRGKPKLNSRRSSQQTTASSPPSL
ncbi:hormogonium polysaccharide biosynthesis protein HpsL [Leptolyngbya ohadii]|uniref:hormogonium polysaccharide biosynthesis protein HpsL n=1 Tax=Leptolyngbya ohadii TaxID=1962290 RepID=UPI0015C60C9D|nr:hormogonium polysaccharide biosynthesis protein HpsL [Leptolyngbya ohadii]